MRCLVTALIFIIGFTASAQEKGLSKPSSPYSFFLTSKAKHGASYNWRIQQAAKVKADGAAISKPAFVTSSWINGVVPGTVLTSLVENKSYPDPYYGDVNRRSNNIIPDMADVGREFYHYWYRTNFKLPENFKGKRSWIKLHGVNYKTEIWLNGRKLGRLDGMFNTKSFDVTDLLDKAGQNILAIDVTPLYVPGTSNTKGNNATGAVGENRNGGNGEIGKNVTMLMSVGWDFTQPDGVRDRNTGIWRDIEVYATGDVVLEQPFTYSKLPLPDTSSAKQQVSVEVYNASTKVQTGLVKGLISEAGIRFQQQVSLQPKERKTVVFAPEVYPQLNLKNPKLWWPLNKGNQYLYHLELSFLQGKTVSHSKSLRFGIREITSDQETPDKSRRFLVNGYPVFIRGTNWIPEAMLRNDRSRTDAELRYTRQAGLNLLRLWGGGIAESDYFFDRCDELGFLVWWLSGYGGGPHSCRLGLETGWCLLCWLGGALERVVCCWSA